MNNHGMIWSFTKEEFAAIVSGSSTFTEIIKRCGYLNVGGGYRMVKKRIKLDGVDDSHISKGLGDNKGKKSYVKRESMPHDQMFREGSGAFQSSIRKRIIRQQLLPYRCEDCGQGPEWNNKPLTLTLDHINGINNDHRLTNLRFLCPNCNSQTSTYGGRNIKWVKRPKPRRKSRAKVSL